MKVKKDQMSTVLFPVAALSSFILAVMTENQLFLFLHIPILLLIVACSK